MKTMRLLAPVVFIGLSSFVAKGAGGEEFDGGVENAAIIAAPDSVKAWRTVGSLNRGHTEHKDYFQKSGKGIPISKHLTARLGEVLLDKNTYPHGLTPGKACTPEPGVVITFSKGHHDLDLYLCFECNILIVDTARDGKKTPLQTGRSADFDPGRAKLLHVIKEIFPNDAQIQSIQD